MESQTPKNTLSEQWEHYQAQLNVEPQPAARKKKQPKSDLTPEQREIRKRNRISYDQLKRDYLDCKDKIADVRNVLEARSSELEQVKLQKQQLQ